MAKIESILGEAYGLRVKKSKKYKYPCYIGEILNKECLEAIGSHSISRGNNLDNHTWYNFQHDSDNPNNKYLMLDQKILKSISEYSASVTHTICLTVI